MIDYLYASEITFDQLKQSASEHSHRLKLGVTDTSIEQARRDTLYSAYYPQLSVGYSGEYNRNFDPSTSGSISVGDTTINSAVAHKDSVAIRLNYELYHFGATAKQIEMADYEVKSKKRETCVEENKLYSEILDHYASGQKAYSEYRTKQNMVTLRRELYLLKQRLFNAGKESRVSIGDEAIRIIDLERDIQSAQMRYEDEIIALSKLSYVELIPKDTNLLSIDTNTSDIQTITYYQSAEADDYHQKILQKESEISMHKRSQMPSVSLYSNYYLYGSDQHNAYDAFTAISPNSWNAGLSIRWTLFEGFKYNDENKRLTLELQRLKQERDLKEREFTYESKTKQEHISHTSLLIANNTQALKETNEKVVMTTRLRAQGETDAVSEVSVKLEKLERELTLENETIQYAYEAESLRLQHMGVDQCTQP